MKKTMIPLLLALALAMGSLGPVPARAAEIVGQENPETEKDTEEGKPEETAEGAEPEETANEAEEVKPEETAVKEEETEPEETEVKEEEADSEESISEAEPEETANEAEEVKPEETAAETGEAEAVYTGTIEAVEETVYPQNTESSPDEMFAGYVDKNFTGTKAPGRKKLRASARSSLTGYDQAVYNYIASEITKIAAGEQSSTIMEITPQIMGLEQTSWTAQDLGVDSIWVLDENGKIAKDENGKAMLNPQAVANVRAKPAINISKIIDALLADFPYELYWYQKKSGTRTVSFSFATAYDSATKTYSLKINSNMVLYFSVADEYAVSRYEMDTSIGQSVRDAVLNAKEIVAKYSDYEDLEKLRGYKDEICRLTSYNYGAAAGGTAYGNPWQMIWVFDNDPDTRVVCEGYSKAFKYLCDQTVFDSDIGCIITAGSMADRSGSGPHMWNVVKMDDGKNYLVDVTNCDVSADKTDRLFLVGTTDIKEDENGQGGYHFDTIPITYYYDEETEGIFAESDLLLCGHNYGAHVWETQYRTDREATCAQEGSESIHCAVCDAVNEETVRMIPMIPHDLNDWTVAEEPTCTMQGKKERSCKNCSYLETETIEAVGHVWETEFTVDKKATKSETGSKSLHCSVCDEIDELSVQVIPKLKGWWVKNQVGWWYNWEDGSYSADTFERIDGRTYRFNASGYMVTGWQKIDGRWYYFAPGGAMATGWQKIGGKWYYMDSDGAMQTGWQKIGGTWYYFAAGGAMQTGWLKSGGKWYYLGAGGAMQIGWLKIGGTWYYLSESGAMVTGRQMIDGKWYYFDNSGAMI